MRFKNRPEWLGDDKMSVNIEIECEEGYDAKRFERGDTLRYYFKGPSGVSNPGKDSETDDEERDFNEAIKASMEENYKKTNSDSDSKNDKEGKGKGEGKGVYY